MASAPTMLAIRPTISEGICTAINKLAIAKTASPAPTRSFALLVKAGASTNVRLSSKIVMPS